MFSASCVDFVDPEEGESASAQVDLALDFRVLLPGAFPLCVFLRV